MLPIARPPPAFSAWIPALKDRALGARPANRALRNLSAQSAPAPFRVRAGHVILKRPCSQEHIDDWNGRGAYPPSPVIDLARRGQNCPL